MDKSQTFPSGAAHLDRKRSHTRQTQLWDRRSWRGKGARRSAWCLGHVVVAVEVRLGLGCLVIVMVDRVLVVLVVLVVCVAAVVLPRLLRRLLVAAAADCVFLGGRDEGLEIEIGMPRIAKVAGLTTESSLRHAVLQTTLLNVLFPAGLHDDRGFHFCSRSRVSGEIVDWTAYLSLSRRGAGGIHGGVAEGEVVGYSCARDAGAKRIRC